MDSLIGWSIFLDLCTGSTGNVHSLEMASLICFQWIRWSVFRARNGFLVWKWIHPLNWMVTGWIQFRLKMLILELEWQDSSCFIGSENLDIWGWLSHGGRWIEIQMQNENLSSPVSNCPQSCHNSTQTPRCHINWWLRHGQRQRIGRMWFSHESVV